MTRDPIVEEVYQARKRILEECGGDLARLMRRLRDVEIPAGSRVVSLESFRKSRQRGRPPTTAV